MTYSPDWPLSWMNWEPAGSGIKITFWPTNPWSPQVCRPGSDSAPELQISEDLRDEGRQLEGWGGMWGGWSHHIPRHQVPSTRSSTGKICPWRTNNTRLWGGFFYYLGKSGLVSNMVQPTILILVAEQLKNSHTMHCGIAFYISTILHISFKTTSISLNHSKPSKLS